MAHQKISIIGAGIGGLVLQRSLLSRGIAATVYEKAQAATHRHNYAITLHTYSYKPLLQILNLDEQDFRSKVGVDAKIGGMGRLPQSEDATSIRVNRARFEKLLQEDLDIKWGSTVEDIWCSVNRPPVLKIENGANITSDVIIGADGVHSMVRNECLPAWKPDVLPFVVFNGKKKFSRQEYDEHWAKNFENVNVVQMKQGDTILSIGLNDVDQDAASLSWIYSRPARGTSDTLYKPSRSNSEAKDTPEDLYQEISNLQQLPAPFATMFDVTAMKEDRTLHWLMRRVLVPLEDLQELGRAGLWMLGDSVHAEQIVGGSGANTTIVDAISMAEHIAERGSKHIDEWYAQQYPRWEEAQKKSSSNIYEIHGISQSKI